MRRLVFTAVLLGLFAVPVAATAPSTVFRVDHVVDGDTVDLTNGAKVRLVQIDTPEVYFGAECYGRQASANTKRLLPAGTRVQLAVEPAADRVDRYGRLLRYAIRARDGLNVNVYLVRIGAAAPYFYDGERGRYAALLDHLARRARALHRGLWGACPHTPYKSLSGRGDTPMRSSGVGGFRFRLSRTTWMSSGSSRRSSQP